VIPGALHRVPSHLRDRHAKVYAAPDYRGTTLQRPLRATHTTIDASGGWFDAGDYVKFVETASFVDVLQLVALRDDTDQPALRAEAGFGLDWLTKMWDPGRRALYYQVGIGDGNGHSILGDHDLWRLPQADDRSRAKPGDPTTTSATARSSPPTPPAGRSARTWPAAQPPRSASAPRSSQPETAPGPTVA
jgi:hypothetical protein